MLAKTDSALSIIEHLIAIIPALWLIGGYLFGLFSLLTRFGTIYSRKISIVADGNYGDLKQDLTDTGLFRESKVSQITNQRLGEVRDSKLLLVDYRYVTDDELKYIVDNKQTNCGLIVYAPPVNPPRRLPDDLMQRVVNHPHTLVVNFRGRLVNDVLTTMLTTPR